MSKTCNIAIKCVVFVLSVNLSYGNEKILAEHFPINDLVVGEVSLEETLSELGLPHHSTTMSNIIEENRVCIVTENLGEQYILTLYFDPNRDQVLTAYTVSSTVRAQQDSCTKLPSLNVFAVELIGKDREQIQFTFGPKDPSSPDERWIYLHSWSTYSLEPEFGYAATIDRLEMEVQYYIVGTHRTVILGLEFDSKGVVELVRISNSIEPIYSTIEQNINND